MVLLTGLSQGRLFDVGLSSLVSFYYSGYEFSFIALEQYISKTSDEGHYCDIIGSIIPSFHVYAVTTLKPSLRPTAKFNLWLVMDMILVNPCHNSFGSTSSIEPLCPTTPLLLVQFGVHKHIIYVSSSAFLLGIEQQHTKRIIRSYLWLVGPWCCWLMKIRRWKRFGRERNRGSAGLPCSRRRGEWLCSPTPTSHGLWPLLGHRDKANRARHWQLSLVLFCRSII